MKRVSRNRGSKNFKAKLTDEDVSDIIDLEGKVSQGDIARRFGVSQSTINHILTGRSWQHITSRVYVKPVGDNL